MTSLQRHFLKNFPTDFAKILCECVNLMLYKAGLRSQSLDWSWSRPESAVLAGVGVGAGVGKILPAPTPSRNRRMPKSTDDNLDRTGMHRLENIEKRRKGEWQCGEKLYRHFVIESDLKKGIGDIFIAVTVSTNSRTVILFYIQRNQRHPRPAA